MAQELRPAIRAGLSIRTRISPVGVWSTVGGAALSLQIWVLGRWLTTSDLRSAPPSGYQISGGRMAAAWTLQVVVAATVLTMGVILARRCLRERTVTFDAALYTGLLLSMWQDPIMYWNKLYVVYNQNLPNVETWGPYIPGWHGPDMDGAPIYESVAGGSGLAYPIVMVWFWLQYKLYRQIARRRPHWSNWRLFLTAAGIGTLIDLPLEPLFLFTGVFAYPVGYPHSPSSPGTGTSCLCWKSSRQVSSWSPPSSSCAGSTNPAGSHGCSPRATDPAPRPARSCASWLGSASQTS